MIIDPDTTGADGETVRVSPSPGHHGHWHMWSPKRDVSDVDALGDKLQLSEWIKTDTLLWPENMR